jgi:hypothetical protein
MKFPTHPLLAAVVQALVVCALHWTPLRPSAWWLGAAFASGGYLFRELTQAEYRWIERYAGGRRANMPWYGQFDPRVWNLKSLLDWLAPIIVTVLVAAVMS